jgi:hypothetical protein
MIIVFNITYLIYHVVPLTKNFWVADSIGGSARISSPAQLAQLHKVFPLRCGQSLNPLLGRVNARNHTSYDDVQRRALAVSLPKHAQLLCDLYCHTQGIFSDRNHYHGKSMHHSYRRRIFFDGYRVFHNSGIG